MTPTRFAVFWLRACLAACCWLLAFVASAAAPTTRPNVLLVILEDWGPHLGCYGETAMRTPHLDRLASEGRLFRYCFTSGPVCSVGRSSLMTGVSQYTTRCEQHRTQNKRPLPAGIRSVPELFRDAGYFTALGCGYSAKLDLNFDFDAKSAYIGKDWKERQPGQPFFAHLTLSGTHRPWHKDPAHPVDPAKVTLPGWYPDTPLTRQDWATGLESAQLSDGLMGELIARLKREGLYDNTAIIVTADHGVALPRSKQFLYDGGLRVPLIIRWPDLAKAGTVSEELVSNLDLVPSMLRLAGIPLPGYLQGRDLFEGTNPPRRFIFAGRDRMDATHDACRAVRSADYKYILNLMAERPYCQFNDYKERSYPGLAVLNVLHLQSKLPPEQDAFMQPMKPPEELYNLRNDPDELHNLATNSATAPVLKTMRAELEKWRQSVGDSGVSDEFRKGGWPATYPTRSLAEWQRIQALWEDHVLRGGPAPQIEAPANMPEGEGMEKPAGKGKKSGRKTTD